VVHGWFGGRITIRGRSWTVNPSGREPDRGTRGDRSALRSSLVRTRWTSEFCVRFSVHETENGIRRYSEADEVCSNPGWERLRHAHTRTPSARRSSSRSILAAAACGRVGPVSPASATPPGPLRAPGAYPGGRGRGGGARVGAQRAWQRGRATAVGRVRRSRTTRAAGLEGKVNDPITQVPVVLRRHTHRLTACDLLRVS